MKKVILAGIVAFSCLNKVQAQMYSMPFAEQKSDKVENLFSSNEDELDLHFQININKGVNLNFSLTRTGLWQGKEEFIKPLQLADEQLRLYADSFKAFANARHMDIHINADNKVISRLRSAESNKELRINSNGTLEALKMNSDTLRIVKAYPNFRKGSKSLTERTQYTFELKDLKDCSLMLKDDEWIDKAVHLIDSILRVYKGKWNNPDAEFHSLYVKYLPQDTIRPLQISKRLLGNYDKMEGLLVLNGGFGTTLVRNTICPSVNVGILFHLRSEEKYIPFVRVSMNTFMRFEEQANKKFRNYSTGFVNAEFGIQGNESVATNKNLLFSMGIGYKLTTKDQFFQDPSMDRDMYKLFFNYGLSKSIILQPELITNFRSKEKSNGWIGMTINFQLF
jgi:hypothetical protein